MAGSAVGGVRRCYPRRASESARHAWARTVHSTSAARMATSASPPALSVVARNLLFDTLEMTRQFQASGLTRAQAEALTEHMTTVLCENRERMTDLYATRAGMEKAVLQHEARIAGFRAEMVKSQELHVASFIRDTERLQANLDKIRAEIRYEVDKLTASQRLDLNLEKGRMRDDLQAMRDICTELEIKVCEEGFRERAGGQRCVGGEKEEGSDSTTAVRVWKFCHSRWRHGDWYRVVGMSPCCWFRNWGSRPMLADSSALTMCSLRSHAPLPTDL